MIFGENIKPEAFEIECTNKDGTNKWLGTFLPNQVELVKMFSRKHIEAKAAEKQEA